MLYLKLDFLPFHIQIEALYNVNKRLELAERYRETRHKIGLDVRRIMDMEEHIHPTEHKSITTKPLRRRHISRTRLVDYHTALLLSSVHRSSPGADTVKLPKLKGYNHAS